MKKYFIFLFFLILMYVLIYAYIHPIFNSSNVIFPYAINNFNIVERYPELWVKLISYFHISNLLVFLILNILYISHLKKEEVLKNNSCVKQKNVKKLDKKTIIKKQKDVLESLNNEKLNILLGFDENGIPIYLKEEGLFQNVLITGSIGTGKTSSTMYPMTRQILEYKSFNKKEKIGGLILDVKGNYYKEVEKILENSGRKSDLIVIDLSGNTRYNPLDKIDLNPEVIANRLKNILLLFSPETTESFWLDKTETLISECIKFIRIYNDSYVDFKELNKIINSKEYYDEKINIVRELVYKGVLGEKEIYDLSTFIDFYNKEFLELDSRTSSIIKSELSRITSIFISNYHINKSFCPKKDEINFHGFDQVIEEGKVVVLNMNISEHRNLSKIIASYLKFDFQTAVLKRLSNNLDIRKTFFICDEYQEYVTESDVSFYSTSREAKCINIIATQSYSSIKNALASQNSSDVIIQNLINKIWFRNDDNYTIESAIRQIGKEEIERTGRTMSENAKNSFYNHITKSFTSIDSGLSESYNTTKHLEDRFNPKFFSQELSVFEALVFISDGKEIKRPTKVKLLPEYLRGIVLKG